MVLFFAIKFFFIGLMPLNAASHFLLEDVRPQIQIPEYSPEEKETLLDVSKNIFYHFNANHFVKEEHFQNQAIVENLFQKISSNITVSSEDLLHTLAKIYRLQYDDHLNFGMPSPYSCYVFSHLVDFSPATGSRTIQLVVSNINQSFNLTDSQKEQELRTAISSISIGDRLVSIDGKSLEEIIKSLQNDLSFPSRFFRLRNLSRHLTYRYTAYNPLPDEDEQTFTFARKNGSLYSLTLPWIGRSISSCLAKSSSTPKALPLDWGGAADEPPVFPQQSTLKKSSSNLHYVEPYISSQGYGWGYYHFNGKKYAYFKLGSFSPSVPMAHTMIRDQRLYVEYFREVWRQLNNDPEVHGLIFDVRDNRGGSLGFATNIIQSFSDETIRSPRFRLKNTTPILNFYRHAADVIGHEYLFAQRHLMEKVHGTGVPYSDLFPIYPDSDEEANVSPRKFYKPTAIFTNERCYSACDAFVDLMKSHKAAIVFGEEAHTGGGGANVWNLGTMVHSYAPANTFGLEALSYKQDIRFPFRAFMRSEDHLPLEDLGADVDEVLAPSIDDIQNGASKQLDTIAARLESLYTGSYPVLSDVQVPSIIVEKPKALSWLESHVRDLGINQGSFDLTNNRIRSKDLQGKYAIGLSTQFILPVELRDTKVKTAKFRLDISSESCCDFVYVIKKSKDGKVDFLKTYSGQKEQEIEVPLKAFEREEIIIWVTSDMGTSKGYFEFSDLRFE